MAGEQTLCGLCEPRSTAVASGDRSATKKEEEEEKTKKLNPDLWVQFFFVTPVFESKHNFLRSFMRLIAFPPNTHLERFHQNLGALTSFFGRNTQSQITGPRQVEMLVPRKM